MASNRKRKPRLAPQAPMLVMRGLVNTDLEIMERMSVDAFMLGYADASHYNTLADMQGAMALAATARPGNEATVRYAKDTVGPVLMSIVRRYQKTGKFGCSGDELKILRRFVTVHREFWLRQPVGLFVQAYAKMKEIQDNLRKSGALVSESYESGSNDCGGSGGGEEGQTTGVDHGG